MSSPFPPDCVCGHQKVEHVSSRSRGLRPAAYGLCLNPDCRCERYEPVQPPLPGAEADPRPERAQAVTFGARPSEAGYRDRDHYDLARDLQAEKEPDER